MLSEVDEINCGDKEAEQTWPAFGVSGQFMMTSEEKSIHSDDFNPRKLVALTLDDSLARLFECLTLEYSGSILLSPKWKNFRSQKLKFAEKTRINNAIWRSWHIQFQMGQRPLFCQFGNPLTEMAKPPKPVTLMVEGRYWKRKLEVVAAEYQKWRVFYKQMVEDKFQDVELQHQTEEQMTTLVVLGRLVKILRLDQEITDNLKEREKERKNFTSSTDSRSLPNNSSPVSLVVSQAFKVADSCNLMESMVLSLPDTLFTSLEVEKKNKVASSKGTFTDTSYMMQPTLDTLQPSLEAMTPVLDDLIEQLESSMKGSELNWDFPGLGKTFDEAMGVVQPSSDQEQYEAMDQSGDYTEQYQPMTLQPMPSSTSSWPVQTSEVTTLAVYPEDQMPGKGAAAPILSQTLNVKLYPENTTSSIIDLTRSAMVSTIVTSSDVTSQPRVPTSQPRVPTSQPRDNIPMVGGQNAATARLRNSTALGSIPRNSSDSLLYAQSTASAHSIPVEVQAPNLVAQLKMTKARHPLVEEKAKRTRIPRNKSAPGLRSLEANAQLKKTPHTGGVRAKKLGRIPRIKSDSSLTSFFRQCEQGVETPRRGSESSTPMNDLPLTRSPPSVVSNCQSQQSIIGTSPSSQRFPQHPLVYPNKVEDMQQDITPLTTTGTSGSPSSLVAMSGAQGGASSQLVSDMVTQLMSKGISIQEILGKLNTMVEPGIAQVSQTPQTSFANISTSRVQAPQGAQGVPLIKGEFNPLLSNVTMVSRSPTIMTRVEQPRIEQHRVDQSRIDQPRFDESRVDQPRIDQSRVDQSRVDPARVDQSRVDQSRVDQSRVIQTRNRRKNQTPRVNLRSVQTERTAVTTDSGLRSTDEIIQNLLAPRTSQSRSGIKPQVTNTPLPTIDPSSIRVTTPMAGSVPRWTNPGSVTPVVLPGSFVGSQVVTENQAVTLPNVFQTSPGDAIFQNNGGENLQFLGVRTSSFTNAGFTPSMLLSTPPVMSIAQATSSARTTEPSNAEVTTSTTPSASFSDDYRMSTETLVRSRPLTKTLPKEQYIEHRRMVHVSAEQKRRGNIKMGFDQLIYMVPSLASQSSTKISKAAILKKSVDYILQVQRETENMENECVKLEKEIKDLHAEISVCQEQLPETGVMVNKPDFNQMELLFNQYIKQRTEHNAKFWIFSIIFRPLFDAYSSSVTTANPDEFIRSVLSWLDDTCSLPKLRPSVLTSLRELIKKTSILTDPARLPAEARRAANSLVDKTTAQGRPT